VWCFEPTTVTTTRLTANHYYKQTETPRKIAQIFTNPVRIVNELAAVGIPCLIVWWQRPESRTGDRHSDLEVKLAEIQRGRAELADEVRDKVALAVFDFDTSRANFKFPGDKQAGSSQASASGCGISFRPGRYRLVPRANNLRRQEGYIRAWPACERNLPKFSS